MYKLFENEAEVFSFFKEIHFDATCHKFKDESLASNICICVLHMYAM